jgi:hypothetical protein
MLEQSFSAKCFEDVFNTENRKGLFDITRFSDSYKECCGNIKILKEQQYTLRRKKKVNWTDEDKEHYQEWENKVKSLLLLKNQIRQNDLEIISEKINSSTFHFRIEVGFANDSVVYMIDNSNESYFAIKQLQSNIQRTFNVKAANRHSIMAQLKLLLNDNYPKYIIRTDVTHFFESIPHNQLLNFIEKNSLLSVKSKKFIKAILSEYDKVKDKTDNPLGQGIPRGIGISSYLAELYMKDLDEEIRKRPEVLFYARYVDDIFILISHIPSNQSIQEYYQKIMDKFSLCGLLLKKDGDDKCSLIDLTRETGSPISTTITYLGYKLYIKKQNRKTTVEFGLSDKKIEKIRNRIDSCFCHFKQISRFDIKRARKELILGLKLITGNVRLSNAKKGIKAGIFYSNDLLDIISDLDNLTDYLRKKDPMPDSFLFVSTEEKSNYTTQLRKRIHKFDFANNWKTRKMYDLSIKQIDNVKEWL